MGRERLAGIDIHRAGRPVRRRGLAHRVTVIRRACRPGRPRSPWVRDPSRRFGAPAAPTGGRLPPPSPCGASARVTCRPVSATGTPRTMATVNTRRIFCVAGGAVPARFTAPLTCRARHVNPEHGEMRVKDLR